MLYSPLKYCAPILMKDLHSETSPFFFPQMLPDPLNVTCIYCAFILCTCMTSGDAHIYTCITSEFSTWVSSAGWLSSLNYSPYICTSRSYLQADQEKQYRTWSIGIRWPTERLPLCHSLPPAVLLQLMDSRTRTWRTSSSLLTLYVDQTVLYKSRT